MKTVPVKFLVAGTYSRAKVTQNANFAMSLWGLTQVQIKEAFEHSQDFVCLLQFGGSLQQVNSKWSEVLGWSEDELLSRPYIEFVHPKDVAKTLTYEKGFIPVGFENRLRCKDGSYMLHLKDSCRKKRTKRSNY
jgi:PAS domain S-box-containing protein